MWQVRKDVLINLGHTPSKSALKEDREEMNQSHPTWRALPNKGMSSSSFGEFKQWWEDAYGNSNGKQKGITGDC